MNYKGWLETRRDTLMEKPSATDYGNNMLRAMEDALAHIEDERIRKRRRDRVQAILSAELNAHMITAALYNRIMEEL